MKMTMKEFESALDIAKKATGEVRTSLLANLKSAEVVNDKGEAIIVHIADMPEIEVKSVEATVKTVVSDALKAEEVKNPVAGKVFATVKSYSKLKNFKSDEDAYAVGKWLKGYIFNDEDSKQFCVSKGIVGKASSGSTLGAGGALVPDLLMSSLIRNVEENGIRPHVRVVRMTSDTLIQPIRSAGMTAAYFGQGTAISQSDSTFAQITLVAKKLGILHLMSSEIGEDALVDIADALAMDMSTAFSDAEEDAFWNGDGTATYGTINGLLTSINDGTHAGSIATALTGNIGFNSLDLVDFHKIVGKLPVYARRNAKWYISAPGFSDSMERLAYASGGNTVDNIQGGSGLSFLGYPVVLQQKLNATLTNQVSTVLLAFGDLDKSSIFGDRRQFAIKSDNGVGPNMASDQVTLLATERFDIVHHSLGNASTAGAVVVLKTPGA